MAKVRIVHAVTVSESVRFMRNQLTYLAQSGYEVSLISSPGKELNQAEAEQGASIIPIKMAREISLLQDMVSLVRYIYAFLKLRPRLSNVGTPKAGLLGGIAAWLTRVPCRIYTVRGLRLETAVGLKRRVLWATERIACLCAHKVVCISPSLQKQLCDLGIVHADKTIILGSGSCNGVQMERYTYTVEMQKQADSLRKQLQLDGTTKVIGFIGRLTKDKGIIELIEAYKQLKTCGYACKLVLVGPYEEGDPVPEAVRAFIKTEPDIVEVGWVDEPAPYFHIMDMLVLPTHREGFGMVAIEAAAAGLPVVTTDATGAIDTVVDGQTGYIVPVGDPIELAMAMAKLLNDPVLAQKMGEQGKERVRKEFQSLVIWEELVRLYGSMLSSKGKSDEKSN